MNSSAPRKRVRLTHACVLCRERKVRCDDAKPDCSNCVRAGVACRTIDPRRPERDDVERRQARPIATAGSPIETPTSLRNEQYDLESQAPAQSQERLPALPRFTSGPTSYILTQWLDIALTRLGRPLHLSQVYQQHSFGHMHLLSDVIGTVGSEWPGDQDEMSETGETPALFSILPLPALQPGWHATSTDNNRAEMCLHTTLSRLRIAILRSFTFVNHTAHLIRDAIAYSLEHLGEVIIVSSHESVQALLLLAILLRTCEQHQQARHIVALAASIAQNLGLNREPLGSGSAGLEADDTPTKQGRRIWWCVYILERTLSFELERSSNIRDDDCTLSWPSVDHTENKSYESDVFVAAVDLGRIQGRVIDRLAQSRVSEEDASISVEEVIRGKIRAIGELDTMLLRWSDGLPSNLRPTEYAFCDTARLPIVAHLALQYYSAMFLLSRHSIIIKPAAIRAPLDRYFAAEPYYQRLASGHNICSNATRSIVGILAHLHESGAYSLLQTQTSSLLAAYGLAVQVIRHVTAVTVRSDVELQEIANVLVRKHQSLQRSSALEDAAEVQATSEVLQTLQLLLKTHLDHANQGDASRLASATAVSVPQGGLADGEAVPRYSHGQRLATQEEGWQHETHSLHSDITLTDWDFNLPFNDGADNELDWDALAHAFNIS